MVATPLASRVSRKLTRECAPPSPRGSRNSLGNRFTSFSTSLYLSSFSSSFSLLVLFPLTAANPPYAPSGSYLRVLLIFSYYRHGHVGTFHAHIRESGSRTYTGYGPLRGPPDLVPFPPSCAESRSLSSSRPPTPSVFLSGTPICEHIITMVRGVGKGAASRGVSRGSEDEVKCVLLVDEENARASEHARKGVRCGSLPPRVSLSLSPRLPPSLRVSRALSRARYQIPPVLA